MSRRPGRVRARSDSDRSRRDTDRIVVAGPNAVDAVLDAAGRRRAQAAGAATAPPRDADAAEVGEPPDRGSGPVAVVHRVFLEDTAGGRSQRLAHRAHALGIPVSMMGKGECDRMAGARCQGVAAEVGYCYADLDDALAGPGLVVFLDSVADPHNLGAVLRTAEAAGARAVVIPERRAAHVSATVMRVSAGAAVFIPVVRVTNLVRSLQIAKEQGFWIFGLAADAEAELPRAGDDPRAGDRVALVVGGEGEGMHRLVREHCDELARLPMHGKVESLNASVAAALAIYRLLDGSLYGPAAAPVG